ncbi:MAG: polyphosphate kinase 1 [Phycisphaerales bacterium]|nr:polyphosphate kinase 1 [Phycisphaerales bacterium]
MPPTSSPRDDDPRQDAPVPPESERFLNREIQWLEFNERVLEQAIDERTPLLERVRFLSIFSSNLDEFFMKRVGGLRRQAAAGVSLTYDGLTPTEQLAAIRCRVLPLIDRQARVYRERIMPALEDAGIRIRAYRDLDAAQRARAKRWYRDQVYPILTPLAVDPGHRFPFISNLSVSLGVLLRRPGESDLRFARLKVPDSMPRWFDVGDRTFVWLPDVLTANLGDVFPGMEIVRVLPFRVTRNADVERDFEDADDLLEHLEQQLRERRFAPVVRMQVEADPDPEIMAFLADELELRPEDLYETRGLIEYRSLDVIADLDRPELQFEPWQPVTSARLTDPDKDIFSIIRQGDVLVHHPYDSFDTSVVRFISEAARDPNVLCIKQALYRTSGDSPFIADLIDAAEHGKQVAVLVELRARFDEQRNIQWARALEDAGVHVAYGVVGLKTHTKIALVVRQEGSGIRCYGHVGTGNYNWKTARLYEDFGLLTCDPEITDDLIDLFNYLTGRSLQEEYTRLLVAPVAMKQRFIGLIDREIEHRRAGRPARIIAKMNQLQDHEVIDALYAASRAGVEIDLIVRGFCTLRPEVPGLSETIRVSSIIGRFLEHSRLFYFRDGQSDPVDGTFLIGSADWMYRNLHARVEAACPIRPRELRTRLWAILEIYLGDRRQAWDMHPDGSYTQRDPAGASTPAATSGTHRALMRAMLGASPITLEQITAQLASAVVTPAPDGAS